MNTGYFPQSIIDKWEDWRLTYESFQRPYFDRTVEKELQVARHLTESAALTDMEGELKTLEGLQSTYSQAIAQGIDKQKDLTAVNRDIRAKKAEISSQERLLETIQTSIDALTDELVSINLNTSFSRFFSMDELTLIDRYVKEGSITESSFVAAEVKSYNTPDKTGSIKNTPFDIKGSKLTRILHPHAKDKSLYTMTGGKISGGSLSAEIIRASFERTSDSRSVDKREINKDWCKHIYMNILKGSVDYFDSFQASLSRYITDFSYNILYGIKKNKHTFYAPLCSNAQEKLYPPLDSQFIKATNRIAKVRLNNEVNIIPAPQSFEEVLKMRKDPAILSFRTVLAEWSEYFSKGEWRLAAKMQSDLLKANKALTKLNHYKETKESPYFVVGSFIVDFITDFIPGLSHILNVMDLSSYFVEKQKEKKYSWILMSTIGETYKPQK